mgnify:CR=1 FL=1
MKRVVALCLTMACLISLAGCAGRASEEAKQEETNLVTETADWLLQEVEEPKDTSRVGFLKGLGNKQ